MPPHSPLRARLLALSVLVALLLVALSSRLWYLQVLAGERYGDLAEGNRVRQVVVEAPRGRILDAHGRVVVRNRAAWAVTVKPSALGDRRREVLGRLARLLGTTRARLEDRIADYTGSPLRGIPVAEDVPTHQLFHLTEHADRFPGVVPEVLALREYPAGPAAAHVLGYVGEVSPDELKTRRFRGYAAGDIVGKAGVELTYDKWLRGRDGVQDLEVNAAGEVVRVLGGRPPAPGRDLQLTLDLNLQVSVEQALADGMRAARRLPDRERGGTYPAPAATAVVLDPDDGALLALASLPQFDPRRFVGGISRRDFARYSSNPGKPLLHRAVQSAYPPGSTWKPFSALAGLKAGIVTPTSTYSCPGSFTLGSYTKRDWTPRGHGAVGLTDSLRLSCDVYYYNLGAQLGLAEQAQEAKGEKVDEKLQATARQFGFGRRPAIDLPYGAEGTVPTREWRRRFWEQNRKTYCAGSSDLYRELCRGGWRWQGGDNLNVAIGQGDLQVSPLQLALGYGALANGGTVYRPHVGLAMLDPASGRVVRRVAPPGRRGGRGAGRRPDRGRTGPGQRAQGGDGGLGVRRVPAGPVPGGRQDRHRRPAAPGALRLVRLLRPGRRPGVRGRGHGRAGRPRRRVGRPGSQSHLPEAVRPAGDPGGPRRRPERLMRESSSPWRHLDPTVVLATLALTALGLLAIYSSTFAGLRAQGLPKASTMRRQLLNLGLGLVVMVAAMAVDYRRLQAWAGVVLGAVAVALGLVLTPLGSATNGAQSWFELGAYQVQPSEYAKVGTIVVLAAVFGARREAPGPRRLAAGLAAMALVCAEILLQPDFGTFMVFVAILFGVLLVSGVQLRWLLVLALVGVLGTVGMFKLNVLREYQKERLTAFIDPGTDDGGRGFTYNSRQALIAIGSGGVGGKGYLRGTQTNLQYVPEQKTDFIFTVIGEELGFAGAMALLALLGLLLWRGLRIAAVARDPFGALLAAGVVTMLAFQAFVNIGMTIGIMPITGIPLPLVSYGGSSLVATFLAVGLLENVHMRRHL